jgi:hypothetical protein
MSASPHSTFFSLSLADFALYDACHHADEVKVPKDRVVEQRAPHRDPRHDETRPASLDQTCIGHKAGQALEV